MITRLGFLNPLNFSLNFLTFLSYVPLFALKFSTSSDIVEISILNAPWKSQIAMFVVISAFWNRFSSSLANFNSLDHQGGWLCKYSATVVVGVAVATFIWRHAWIRRKEHHGIHDSPEVRTTQEASTSEDSELKCSCGLLAKLRISRTLRNPYRLFYNCSNNAFHHQCEYFHWSDETSASIERSRKEITYLRSECIRLHKKISYVESRRENDRLLWERERLELRSKVSSVQEELDDIKRRIQHLYELDNMPPFDGSCIANENDDWAIVTEAL